MNKTWSVIITIILTAAVVGGGAYYYLGNKAEEEKADLQSQIDELEDEVSDLRAQLSAEQRQASDEDREEVIKEAQDNWKEYKNDEYGFSLTFNDLWKDYELVSKDVDSGAKDTLYVCVPTESTTWSDVKPGLFCPFAISIVELSEWSSFRAANEPLIPKEIGRNSSYVFTKSTAHENPDDVQNVMNDIDNIVDTFSVFNI